MNIWFGRKLVARGDARGTPAMPVSRDQLGSVGKYFPYGEERNYPALPNDQEKFATYMRDSATGLDYAMNRYYSSTFGRFMTADPYRGSDGRPANLAAPQSWDRYTYVENNSINGYDPNGTCTATVEAGGASVSEEYACILDNLGVAVWAAAYATNGSNNGGLYALLQYADQHQSSVNWAFTQKVLASALNDLKKKPECAKLFGTAETRNGAWNPGGNVLATWMSPTGGRIGWAFMRAIFVPWVPGGRDAETFIIPNSPYTLINNSTWNAWAQVPDVRQGELTLLHELGHVYNSTKLAGSGGSEVNQYDYTEAANRANDDLIINRCFH